LLDTLGFLDRLLSLHERRLSHGGRDDQNGERVFQHQLALVRGFEQSVDARKNSPE
jgi:hypothetical protein